MLKMYWKFWCKHFFIKFSPNKNEKPSHNLCGRPVVKAWSLMKYTWFDNGWKCAVESYNLEITNKQIIAVHEFRFLNCQINFYWNRCTVYVVYGRFANVLFASFWSRFALYVLGQFPNCFRLISGWKNEVYTWVSLFFCITAERTKYIDAQRSFHFLAERNKTLANGTLAKRLLGETTGHCISPTDYNNTRIYMAPFPWAQWRFTIIVILKIKNIWFIKENI